MLAALQIGGLMNPVLFNGIAIIAGVVVGILFKKFLNGDMLRLVEEGMGYCVVILGVKMASGFNNIFIFLGSIAAGAFIGYYLRVTERVSALSDEVSAWAPAGLGSSFAKGATFASIVFCSGAMAVVGSINAAVGDPVVLIAKSTIDFFLSVLFATLYGCGVALSALPVIIYEGAIYLGAGKLSILSQEKVLQDLSGVSGVLLMMIGLNLAKITTIKVADFLPAIVVAFIASAWVASSG